MSILRVPPPRQTSFGSMLYFQNGNKKQHQEFATEDEAEEFANELKFAIEKEREKYEVKSN